MINSSETRSCGSACLARFAAQPFSKRKALLAEHAARLGALWSEQFDLQDFPPVLWEIYRQTRSEVRMDGQPPPGLRKRILPLPVDQLIRLLAAWHIQVRPVIKATDQIRFLHGLVADVPADPYRRRRLVMEIVAAADRATSRFMPGFMSRALSVLRHYPEPKPPSWGDIRTGFHADADTLGCYRSLDPLANEVVMRFECINPSIQRLLPHAAPWLALRVIAGRLRHRGHPLPEITTGGPSSPGKRDGGWIGFMLADAVPLASLADTDVSSLEPAIRTARQILAADGFSLRKPARDHTWVTAETPHRVHSFLFDPLALIYHRRGPAHARAILRADP